ncbi:hypothetical protein [Deinococcus actinosclerus]|uniref:Nucleotidyltransferase domain-containing protein n=1 Tax=Deinococcus actinosclerus TaxID=1768108 RepID=A0ABM5X3S6_9DEIO|nr:hypothetical protein [Deinococcus actinosclerus]ALW88394.1 hypothetical protein AUC44_05395 [Deinococcus actinosclerus]
MTSPDAVAALLHRLDLIAGGLAASGRALALLGLGSVGAELDRMDQFSDLDFFVVARDGQVRALLEDLGWLGDGLVQAFRNTPDGFKVLFEGGVYGEFAVFDEAALRGASFVNARVVWLAPDAPRDLPLRRRPAATATARLDAAARTHHLGEALTNLLVGVRRFRRGERLSAWQFTQVYALGHALALAADATPPAPGWADAFGLERRFEARYPGLAAHLGACLPGLDGTPGAALGLLNLLEELRLPEWAGALPLAGQVRREAGAALAGPAALDARGRLPG